jgi:hypothetical protein
MTQRIIKLLWALAEAYCGQLPGYGSVTEEILSFLTMLSLQVWYMKYRTCPGIYRSFS